MPDKRRVETLAQETLSHGSLCGGDERCVCTLDTSYDGTDEARRARSIEMRARRKACAAYVPVPVAAAQQIAHDYGKAIVIVIAYDTEHGRLHTTTYGTDERSKAWAADGGEIAVKALGVLPQQAEFYENYRQHCCFRSGHIVLSGAVLKCVAHEREVTHAG